VEKPDLNVESHVINDNRQFSSVLHIRQHESINTELQMSHTTQMTVDYTAK